MEFEFYKGIDFWKKPSRYKPGPVLLDETLAQVEETLGKQLPSGYVRYMREQNGGELTFSYVRFDDGDVASIPFLHEIEIESGVGLSPVFVDACGFSSDIVLLSGDLDSWLALDYRKNIEEPEVIYIIGDQGAGEGWKEHLIAPTFEAFTKKLFTNTTTSL